MSEKFTQKKADKSTRTQPALPNARHDRSLDDRGSLETIRSCDAAGHLRCFPARDKRLQNFNSAGILSGCPVISTLFTLTNS